MLSIIGAQMQRTHSTNTKLRIWIDLCSVATLYSAIGNEASSQDTQGLGPADNDCSGI